MRNPWYDIKWEEAYPVPVWRSSLSVNEEDGTGTLEGDWQEQPRSGFVVRVKWRVGALTFVVKQVFAGRSPKKAKAVARKLVKETEQWLAAG